MRRRFVGHVGRAGEDPGGRLRAALAPQDASLLASGPLTLAFTGGELGVDGPLCVLDGLLDDEPWLAAELGLDAGTTTGEALLRAAYRRWGSELAAHLRGDFAFVLWDAQRGEGIVARDQLGVRGVYLHEAGGVLRFAGEARDLLASMPSRPGPDRASVAHWLSCGRRPGAHTMYEGVRRLDPGCVLRFDGDGGAFRQVPYWRPRYREPADVPFEQRAAEVRGGLELAVARRLDRQGATGVLMSGGLDSSSVAAVAARLSDGAATAHAGVFPSHPGVDESALVSELRSSLGLAGVTAKVDSGGLLASAFEFARVNELPLLGWSDFWTVPLLRAAADSGVRATLGGDGGDELFGTRVYLLADALRAGRPRQAVRLAHELPGAGSRPPYRQMARLLMEWGVAGALPPSAEGAVRSALGRTARGEPSWLLARTRRDLRDTDDPLAWKRLDGPRWWAHAAHGLTRGIEELGLFEHQRLRAATVGVDARHPLFDLDLLELALRQPPEVSFDPVRNRPLLRAAVAGLLPESVRLRPAKAWFEPLIADCLTGPDSRAVRGLLLDPAAEIGAYVEPERLRSALLDRIPAGGVARFRWMQHVWRLTTAECWLRAQSDAPGDAWPASRETPSAARVSLGWTSGPERAGSGPIATVAGS